MQPGPGWRLCSHPPQFTCGNSLPELSGTCPRDRDSSRCLLDPNPQTCPTPQDAEDPTSYLKLSKRWHGGHLAGNSVGGCRMIHSIPGLCPLDASNIPHPNITTKNVSRHCTKSPGRGAGGVYKIPGGELPGELGTGPPHQGTGQWLASNADANA